MIIMFRHMIWFYLISVIHWTFSLPNAVPCEQLHPDLPTPCLCQVFKEGLGLDCDGAAFRTLLPPLPSGAPIIKLSHRYGGLYTLPPRVFPPPGASAPPIVTLSLAGNNLRRLTDRLLVGLRDTLENLDLADNLLGDNLNPIFATTEFHGLSQLKRLDLSGNMIVGLEEGIFHGCDNLQELRLERNELTTVPATSLHGPRGLLVLSLSKNHIENITSESMSRLSSLQSLDLSWNSLRVIEGGSLSGLSTLRHLNLTRNLLARFNSDAFQGAENIHTLILSENFISEYPALAINSLPNLKYLNISSNLILALNGNELAASTKLEVLDLSRNRLAHISPGTFSGLSRLRYLNLGVNALRTIDDTWVNGLESLETLILTDNNVLLVPSAALSRLPHLDLLDLGYNRITALSAEILSPLASASHVHILRLTRNVIRELPPGCFKDMNNLKEMDLSGNLLVSISAPVFTGLEDELRVLRISQNRISSFIGRPLDLPHLNTLDLSKNELSELPRNVFALLPELKYLNLSDNRLLASIPGMLLSSLPHLEIVDMSGSGLRVLPSELFSKNTGLKSLLLARTQLSEISEMTFDELKNLTVLDLSFNRIQSLRKGVFNGLIDLQELSLRGNRLTAFKGEAFGANSFSHLKLLDLTENELGYLFPSSFRVHIHLLELHLGKNKLSVFPGELIVALKELKFLNLTGNQLKNIDELDFARLPKLRELYLANNNIESISESAFHNSTQLQVLDISQNQLERIGERVLDGLLRIERLDLSDNLLHELPDGLLDRARVGSIKDIILAGNRFEEAPLEALQRQYFFLSLVDLSRNRIVEIPADKSIMVNIKRLDLSSNPLSIQAINNILGEPKTVRELNLANTGVTQLPTILETPFLKHLNLSGNKLKDFDYNCLTRATLLQDLDISNNSLSSLEMLSLAWPQLPRLKSLSLAQNPIERISEGHLDGLKGLTALDIHGLHSCTRLEKKAFRELSKLANLTIYEYPRLGYLDVKGLLEVLPALEYLDLEVKDPSVGAEQLGSAMRPRLTYFSLRGDRLHSVSPGSLAGLRAHSLHLAIRNSAISTLHPSLFFPLPRSAQIVLDLSDSQIKTLPAVTLAAIDERRGDLRLIGLNSNPINCDCQTRALKRWGPAIAMHLRCYQPSFVAGKLLSELGDAQLTCDESHTTANILPKTSTKRMMRISTTSEPEIIWNLRTTTIHSIPAYSQTGQSSNGGPSSSNQTNDDTLIIGIVGGVVTFIAILILVMCLVRLRLGPSQYQGGPLAMSSAGGIASPSVSSCTCIKPPALYLQPSRTTYYSSPAPYFISYEEKHLR